MAERPVSEPEDDKVLPGTEGTPYDFLKCPVLERYRCSLLCRTICADSAWSDKRASEVRSECDSWSEYRDIKSNLEEE